MKKQKARECWCVIYKSKFNNGENGYIERKDFYDRKEYFSKKKAALDFLDYIKNDVDVKDYYRGGKLIHYREVLKKRSHAKKKS